MSDYSEDEWKTIAASLKVSLKNVQSALENSKSIEQAEYFEDGRIMLVSLIQKVEGEF